MSSFGSCLCCGKTIAYEKINLCKECKESYIGLIKKYVKENGRIGSNGRKTVDIKEIKDNLGISTRVLNYFAEEKILDLIFNDEEIPDEKDNKQANRRELIKNLQLYGNEMKQQANKQENPINRNAINTGMHIRGRK